MIGCAIEVHCTLGPRAAGIAHTQQQALPVIYKGRRIDRGLRIDIVVDAALIPEIKTVSQIMPLHEA